MGPSSQFSTKVPQRTQHFYGFFYVQTGADSFHRPWGKRKNQQEKSKGQRNSLSCESKLLTKKLLETGARTGDQQNRSPRVCRSINYPSGPDPAYFYTFLRLSSGFYILLTHRLRIGLLANQQKKELHLLVTGVATIGPRSRISTGAYLFILIKICSGMETS